MSNRQKEDTPRGGSMRNKREILAAQKQFYSKDCFCRSCVPLSVPAKKPWYRRIHFFLPWKGIYVGVQFDNCTWFLFQWREPRFDQEDVI